MKYLGLLLLSLLVLGQSAAFQSETGPNDSLKPVFVESNARLSTTVVASEKAGIEAARVALFRSLNRLGVDPTEGWPKELSAGEFRKLGQGGFGGVFGSCWGSGTAKAEEKKKKTLSEKISTFMSAVLGDSGDDEECPGQEKVAVKFYLDKNQADNLDELKTESDMMVTLKDCPRMVTYKAVFSIDKSGMPEEYKKGEAFDHLPAKLFAVVMPRYDMSLQDMRNKAIVLAYDKKFQIVKEIAETLSCVTSKGVVHRDIKTGNIAVKRNGDKYTPYIIDLGLADTFESAVKYCTRFGGHMPGTRGWKPNIEALQAATRRSKTSKLSKLYQAFGGTYLSEACTWTIHGWDMYALGVMSEKAPLVMTDGTEGRPPNFVNLMKRAYLEKKMESAEDVQGVWRETGLIMD